MLEHRRASATRAEFFESGTRDIEVAFVEELDTVDQIAFDHEEFDHSPLGIEALSRGALSGNGE